MTRLEEKGLSVSLVSGDTAARAKPHPDPLLHACDLIARDPTSSWYVGDDERDIRAGRAAGMRTLAAVYGYLGVKAPPHDWGADGLLEHPLELLDFLDLATSMDKRVSAPNR